MYPLVRELADDGIPVSSMGQVGSAGDNAAMESFFALLQRNVLDRRTWSTRDELRIAMVTWIERTYQPPPEKARSTSARSGRVLTPSPPRPSDPDRIRNDHDPSDGNRRLTTHCPL